jgi:hypothetical protein
MPDNKWRTGTYNAVKCGTTVLYELGAAAALGAMVVLFGVGIIKAGVGTCYLVRGLVWGSVSFEQGVECFLKGIEILILAPMAYLVFATISTYAGSIHQIILLRRDDSAGGDHDQKLEQAKLQLRDCHNLLQQVKQIIAGLFVALLLTDFITKIFEERQFTSYATVAQGVALGLAVAYYYVLSDRPRRSPNEPA